MRLIAFILLTLSLGACNSVYMKPHTLDKDKIIYSQRGGYSMQRAIKETMENRGYKVSVGIVKTTNTNGTRETIMVPDKARYAVRVHERKEILRPLWCMFNGFWWWNFEISVSDRTKAEEILSWRGRGCANSSVKKLNDILDELEIQKDK